MESEPDNNPLEDTALMSAARAGDMEAFSVLVRKHQRGLVNFFTRLGASSYAEDLAQETFVRLFKYRDRYTPSAKFTTFLYTLGRHAWCDMLRKWQRRDRGLALLQADAVTRDEERNEPREQRAEAVRTAVARLPEKLRLVVVLGIYEGFDYETIGRIAGIPVGTVKSRMFLAMQKLKEWLKAEEGSAVQGFSGSTVKKT
jgi:RNA polymerase sigma-70 factor, ECF subfamily